MTQPDTSGDLLSRRVIGCAYRVSNTLGSGFLEAVYHGALSIELSAAGIAHEREKHLDVCYRGQSVGRYMADFIVEERLLIEVKALRALAPEHDAQVINYLRASGLGLGLLLNFGQPRVQVRRLVWHHDDARPT